VTSPAGHAYVDATPVPPAVSPYPWDVAAARWRLERLRADLPVRVPADAAFRGGNSNDVWMFDDLVVRVRVCWRGDRDRLLREAAVLGALPPGVPHAPLVDVGRTDDVSWTVTGLVTGSPLDVVADRLPITAARGLYADMAGVLQELHSWRPPASLRSLVTDRPGMRSDDQLSIWASDLMPLPVSRALTMIDLAAGLRYVDPALVKDTRQRIVELATADPFADPQASTSVVHADATPGNFLVHNGKISALLDFEWVRWAPPDHELVSLVRMAQPQTGPVGRTMPRLPILAWLAEDYPGLFTHPDLDRRLWLSEIVYVLHGVIWWPPDQPESTLTPAHHVHTLRRLVESPWPYR